MDPDESLPLPSGRIILGRGRPAPNWPEEKKPSFRPQDSGHSWSRIESKSRSERPRITSIPKGTSQWTKSLDTKVSYSPSELPWFHDNLTPKASGLWGTGVGWKVCGRDHVVAKGLE
eukprot:184960-Amorphochlora_amoeboformis.AAC.1